MLYLVNIKYVETGVLYPSNKLAKLVERAIVPSLQGIVKMQKDGKLLAGGVHAASRASVLIIEAKDHTELSGLLQALPFWSIMTVKVTPLQSFDERATQEAHAVGFLKKLGQDEKVDRDAAAKKGALSTQQEEEQGLDWW